MCVVNGYLRKDKDMLEILLSGYVGKDIPEIPEEENKETEEISAEQPSSRISGENFGVCFSADRSATTIAALSLKNSGTLYILKRETDGVFRKSQEITVGGLTNVKTHTETDRKMVSVSPFANYVAVANIVNKKIQILKLNNQHSYEKEQEISVLAGLAINGVKLLDEGNKIVLCANNSGGFAIYERDGDGIFQLTKNNIKTGAVYFFASDETGDTIVTTNSNGTSPTANPKIEVYKKSEVGNYSLVQTISSSSYSSGGYAFSTIGISGDGKTLIAGDFYKGKAFVFKLQDSLFKLKQTLSSPIPGTFIFGFGIDSSYTGKTIAVGGPGFYHNTTLIGACFIFKEDKTGTYVSTNIVRSSQSSGSDYFGVPVQLTPNGRYCFVGGHRFEGKGGVFSFSI